MCEYIQSMAPSRPAQELHGQGREQAQKQQRAAHGGKVPCAAPIFDVLPFSAPENGGVF